MVGNRSEAFYIDKFGEEEGRKKYAQVEKDREKRARRNSANRKIVLGEDLEYELSVGNAVKCEACGYIGTNLQWTHFVYKCVPEMNTIDDYKKLYPDAPLKAGNLVNLTAINLEAMISLYGEEEGKIKFGEYCNKQADTNTFEYKNAKYGMTKEEFDEYNKSRSVTLENLIARHGEEIGIMKWDAYCEQQRYTTSLEYFVKTYGQTDGTDMYNNFVDKRNLRGKSEMEYKCYEMLKEHIEDLTFQYRVNNVSGECDMGNSKIVIEFNGTYWHCDPRVYSEDFVNSHTKRSSLQTWQKDAKKYEAILNEGYRLYVIWEYDFTKHMDKSIANLLEWINGTEQTGSSSDYC